jgi:hypothetical protein|tara:strand:+ start:3552 stop:4499 length:948 start_codon:yes stop_codon:yes gene_type:complete
MAKTPAIVKEIQLTPKRELNYGFQKNISYSQYSMWKKCPKQWALQYRDGHKIYKPSVHTVFGKALHEAFQHYIQVMYDTSAAAADREDILELLKNKIREHYQDEYKKNKSQHFSNPGELSEFYKDGVEILNYLKKNRGKYFSKRGWHLVGIETPILMAPMKYNPNVLFMGYLDIVMYNERLDKFKIIDIKTSTNGWKLDYVKKDEDKQFQLILYKKFFAEQFGVPVENIDIEFFITRRKVYEEGDFPQKRFQMYSPPSGKIKISRATKAIEEFMSECFIENKHSTKEMLPNPSKWNCTFCAFKEDKKLCGLGASL